MSDGQMSLLDIMPEQVDIAESGQLQVVHAKFESTSKENWKSLFEGFDELYGITFSSGIHFMEKVMDMFDYVEMIFGCEGVLTDDVAAIMAMEASSVEQIAKSKSAKRMAERIEEGSMALSVSRDTKSHEKVYILKAKDGRTRVITGSANMSASAFCAFQREDIVCFENPEAFEHYMDRYETFRDVCSDNVNHKVILATSENEDYIRDNIEELPIIRTIEKKKMIVLEPSEDDNSDIEIIANIKGLENEIKSLIPKQKKASRKILLNGEYTKAFKRKYTENVTVKKEKTRQLPKLHIDYDARKLLFNGKDLNLNPGDEQVKSDLHCIVNYMSSLSSFYGDWRQSQKDYFSFMNWYFASLFMPYLRYVGSKNGYDVTPFPVFGIIYGDSNGGKSTFIKLLSKLMCGIKIPLNSSGDFTNTTIDNLKKSCEGLPINIDDLAKNQYDQNYEKIIKDDGWGIVDQFINYPAIAISTNKVASLKPDITKRVVTCCIGIMIDKEMGAKNSKRINESMRHASTALYCEYVRRMFTCISEMVENIKSDNEDYFPDIFETSSIVLKEIFEEYLDEVPEYITELSYSDYFGDKAVGKNAMKKVVEAWNNDRKNFYVDKKKNTLTYTYADSSRTYELRYIQQELPPVLNSRVIGSSIVMDLDKAKILFSETFKKHFWDK